MINSAAIGRQANLALRHRQVGKTNINKATEISMLVAKAILVIFSSLYLVVVSAKDNKHQVADDR